MVPHAMVRQFAAGQQIGLDVADQDVVLHYVLELLSRAGLFRAVTGEQPGPLLFKGGTALRKCVFGETGRFSQDIDVDATHKNGFEATIEAAFSAQSPFYDISFSIPDFRYSAEGNFSGQVSYEHEHGSGNFELQISYRLEPILDPVDLQLQPQPYFKYIEFAPPALSGLDPYEMIGEKVMACNRRLGGSAKDVYDLFLWSQRPFDEDLVRPLATLKAWTDQRGRSKYEPHAFLESILPGNYRWEDLRGLVPRQLRSEADAICRSVRDRFAFLGRCTPEEELLLEDQTSHRERRLFGKLRTKARERSRKSSGSSPAPTDK